MVMFSFLSAVILGPRLSFTVNVIRYRWLIFRKPRWISIRSRETYLSSISALCVSTWSSEKWTRDELPVQITEALVCTYQSKQAATMFTAVVALHCHGADRNKDCNSTPFIILQLLLDICNGQWQKMNDWITIFYNSIATTINITDHQGQQVNSFSLGSVYWHLRKCK